MRQIALLLMVWCTGCALPLPGGELLMGYAASNPEKKMLHRVVPGIDVHFGAWNGLTLGWSETFHISPTDQGDPQAAQEARWSFCPPFGLEWVSDEGTRHCLGWVYFDPGFEVNSKVGFFYGFQAGAWSTWSTWDSHTGIGLGHGTVLYCDEDEEVLVELRFDSSELQETSFKNIGELQ